MVHENWEVPVTLLGDAMLLHLEAPSSRPAMPLARAGTTYGLDPSVPNAAGWGLTDEAATIETSVLKEAFLAIYEDADCRGYDPTYDANTQTCAFTKGVAGVCHGDSGGPLTVLDQAGTPHLWGITSYGVERPPGTRPVRGDAPGGLLLGPRVRAVDRPEDRGGAGATAAGGGHVPATARPAARVAAARYGTAPLLSRARLSTTKLRAARSGGTISRQTGAKLSFTLSEAAAVRVTVLRGTKSLAPSATFAGQAGKTTKTFTGRLGGRKLKRGRYRLPARRGRRGG